MPLINSETGKKMSEREAYIYAVTDRLQGIERHTAPGEEKTARLEPLSHLQREFQVISERFERQNRELQALSKPPLPEAALRPEFVRALHAAQDEAAKYPRPYRAAAVSELTQLDRKLEGIQKHYETHGQKETTAQKEPPPQQSQQQRR